MQCLVSHSLMHCGWTVFMMMMMMILICVCCFHVCVLNWKNEWDYSFRVIHSVSFFNEARTMNNDSKINGKSNRYNVSNVHKK